MEKSNNGFKSETRKASSSKPGSRAFRLRGNAIGEENYS
jgi:hypothetical protein